jgi:MarR family transcriptional regulator, organic hydroperoxide resistance regulator
MAASKGRKKLERAAWTEIRRFVDAQSCTYADACEACGLTPPQASLMLKLEPGGAYPMATLANALSCHASNVTGIVDRLEEQGLLERRPSAEDRRVKHISMTPAGTTRREQLLDRTYEAPGAFAALDPDELETLTTLITRLRTAT